MSFILLGILNSQVSGAAGGSYELIESNILTSSASSVTFSSIPQDYKHLQIRAVVQPTVFATSLNMQLNGVTTSSYAWHALRGTGSAVQSQGSTGQSNIQTGEPISAVASIFAPYVIDILDYANTSKNTTVRLMYGNIYSGNYWVGLTSGLLLSTNAITSATFYFPGRSHVAGTRFSLYGIRG